MGTIQVKVEVEGACAHLVGRGLPAGIQKATEKRTTFFPPLSQAGKERKFGTTLFGLRVCFVCGFKREGERA